MADLDQTIEDTAKNPKAVAVDGTRVDAQSVDDLIKADQHLAGKEALKNSLRRGLRFNKLVPPGTSY
jgi:hypothetical protein